MVEDQLLSRGISDERLLAAFRNIPRHLFVPQKIRSLAYKDSPLSVGNSQTISQPYMVAIMTELLALRPDDKVLEIGSGSGYQTAILASLAQQVFSLERIPELADLARRNLAEAAISNAEVIIGDGTLGHAEEAPYDKIIVTAAAPHLPSMLSDQLADGGKIVIPVGPRLAQDLMVFRKEGDTITSETHVACRFVPLIGEDGWRD